MKEKTQIIESHAFAIRPAESGDGLMAALLLPEAGPEYTEGAYYLDKVNKTITIKHQSSQIDIINLKDDVIEAYENKQFFLGLLSTNKLIRVSDLN